MTLRCAWLHAAAALLVTGAHASAQGLPSSARLLDDFETTAGWSAHPSDGVTLAISSDSNGVHGRAMRLDFDFHGHGGYAIARKAFDIAMPENYAFSYRLRGQAPVENLEFKLVDSTGDNVWWNNAVNVRFPEEWRMMTLKKRHISFAWGPVGGGDLKHLASLEISITAGSGGKGTIWLDALTFTPLEPVHAYRGTPVASATSSAAGHEASLGADGRSATFWKSDATAANRAQTFTLDFGAAREYGGATVDWAPGAAAAHYIVETSADGARWDSAYAVTNGNGGRDWIYLPDYESRYLRVRIPSPEHAVAIRELAVVPVEWGATRNEFWKHIAASAPAGSYPRYFSDKQSFWTIVGVAGDGAVALMNEQGAIEPHAGGFSLEPFLRVNGKFITWHDARQTQSLAEKSLPIPTVTWTAGAITMAITTFAAGARDSSSLYARYRITNTGSATAKPTLYLAVRPFQVNPSWQFLATQGGDAPIRSLAWQSSMLRVNDTWSVIPLTAPGTVGASTFDEGDIVESLRTGMLPARLDVKDPQEHASAALGYPLTIAPRESKDVYVLMPLHDAADVAHPFATEAEARAFVKPRYDYAVHDWNENLSRTSISLPPSAARVSETLRTQLSYILINTRGPRINPGARSYARSWIRDGSMIGAALLRLGHPEQVRAFLEWYAPYQFPNGKVPCCVDARGSDPVPENDSHGELIYAIADYFRYTGDTAFLSQQWPHVVGAVAYMDSLRAQRLTADYDHGAARAYRGLFPQSISHEGYSAKAMHSFWDDLFGLRGYVDATYIATVLHRSAEEKEFAAKRDTFRADIMASYRASMADHHIDFLPGSLELGDFDATSTTVGVAPVGELASLPDTALRRTFDKYWENSTKRRQPGAAWDAYTPYELRTVGTFVRLGEKQRALSMLDFFFSGQRPAAWRQWAEVVWHDRDTPKFIGDMPHTWVGSDYIRSVLDMFAYDRASDSALVVGAGIAERWVREAPGVKVRALGTPYGPIHFDARATGNRLVAHLGGSLRMPAGGIAFVSPVDRAIKSAKVDGARVIPSASGEVIVRKLPATIILTY